MSFSSTSGFSNAYKTPEFQNTYGNLPGAYESWDADNSFGMDNPYRTAYRDVSPSQKNRYMFNVGLTYNILDWLNINKKLGELPEYSGYKQIYLQAGNVENRGWEASLGYSNTFYNGDLDNNNADIRDSGRDSGRRD